MLRRCTDKGCNSGSTSDHDVGPGATAATCPAKTDFTADEYLSRSKKFSAAKKKFRVSDSLQLFVTQMMYVV